MKSATMRYCNSGVISHEIPNHEIQDIGHTFTDMNILDSLIQSTNQINKQGQSNQLINLINQERLRIRLAHHSRDFGLVHLSSIQQQLSNMIMQRKTVKFALCYFTQNVYFTHSVYY